MLAESAAAYPKISLETVVRLQPDVIIDMGDMAQTEGVTEQHKRSVEQLWKSRADIRSRVHAVASDIFVYRTEDGRCGARFRATVARRHEVSALLHSLCWLCSRRREALCKVSLPVESGRIRRTLRLEWSGQKYAARDHVGPSERLLGQLCVFRGPATYASGRPGRWPSTFRSFLKLRGLGQLSSQRSRSHGKYPFSIGWSETAEDRDTAEMQCGWRDVRSLGPVYQ